jgi:cAMP-dependent protein kinase regulator
MTPTMADLRKLKQEALDSASKGNWRKAVWCYANLEKDDPSEPAWSLRLGEALRKLGNDGEAIKAFSRAVSGYAKGDLLLKAIAVCKIILGIDPKHQVAQELLASFYAAQRKPTEPVPILAMQPPSSPTVIPTLPEPGTPADYASALPAQFRSTSVPPSVLAPAPPEPFEAIPTPILPRPAVVAAPSGTMGPPPASSPATVARGPTLRPLTVATAPLPPPLRQLRLSSLLPGAQEWSQIPSTGGSSARIIPLDGDFAPGAVAPTNPHKGAGRATMARFVLPKTPFFSVLTPELLAMAIGRVQLIQLPAGEILFSQGDPGDALYVVAWGEVAVLVPQEVARLSEGEFFGEIALLADRPRTATVRATVDTKVLAFDRALLGDLIAASPELLKVLLRFVRERLIATLAETSPLFAPFTPLERIGLAARFHIVELDAGLRVIEEGAKSPGLFVLLAGAADAVAGDTVVAHLDSGDVFGEMSLITGQPATASVVVSCKSFVLFLPKTDFAEVIMTHPQVLEHVSALVDARAAGIGRVAML